MLERECLALREEVEQLNEKEEVLAILMEGKMSMQKVAPDKYQEKFFQELKVGHCSGAFDNSSFGSCSPSLALDTDEAMSASSKMAQDAEDAMSVSSWTAVAKGKERGWWSIDLEGEMEKLEVVGPCSGTEGGSVDPKWKMGHRQKVKAERG